MLEKYLRILKRNIVILELNKFFKYNFKIYQKISDLRIKYSIKSYSFSPYWL